MSSTDVNTVNNTDENVNTENDLENSPEETKEELTKKLKKSEKSVKKYQHLILRLIIILAVIWLLFFVIIGLTHMPSGDMYPRVDAGDMVLFYRLDKDVKAQDVIVIQKAPPESTDKEVYISRVVAVAGDTVEITEAGSLIINGNNMIESNIFYTTPPYEGFTEYPITLGPDECFVLADSREGGTDSRYFGPVNKNEILGTVITILRRNNL